MKKQFSATMAVAIFVGAALAVGVSSSILADAGHDHGKKDSTVKKTPKESNGMKNMAKEGHGHGQKMTRDGHGHGQKMDHHSHDNWIEPPPKYANKQSDRWADLAAIERGQAIYQQHCAMCHGVDGEGAGPMGKALAHQPADLTNHFHEQPGDGDAYLFWRVSKGGTVEPFRSQGSAMPAFETILNEEQRWDVLAYVHTFFHMGLDAWASGAKSD